jgi:4-carboxymuconolactone decarboxylase
MRRLSLIAFAVLAFAQTLPKIELRGDRFKPLTWDTMTPEQKKTAQSILSGERTSLNGPFNVMLRSPEMADLEQKFGAQLRFHSSIPKKLNEMAIIITASTWRSQYEWYAHRRAAADAGLNESIIQAIAKQTRPASMSAEEKAVYDFCTELLTKHEVSDATFGAAKEKFGERGIVDLMGVMGHYTVVSMMLNVDRYPLPEGAKPELTR